jgi:hypothetical protein
LPFQRTALVVDECSKILTPTEATNEPADHRRDARRERLGSVEEVLREGLGCKINMDCPSFVEFDLGEGSSSLALYEWEAAARDAGVSSEGSGFRATSLHFIVPSSDAVDDVVAEAKASGATVVKEPAEAQWGGYFGYFPTPTAICGRSRRPRSVTRLEPATRRPEQRARPGRHRRGGRGCMTSRVAVSGHCPGGGAEP